MGKRSHVFAPLRQPPGNPVAPRTNRLPLLPSGPDGVHGALPHRTQQLTKRCKHARRRGRDLNPRELSLYELSRPAHSARLCDLSESKGAYIRVPLHLPFQKPNQYSQTALDEQIRGNREVVQFSKHIKENAVPPFEFQLKCVSPPTLPGLYCPADNHRAASLAK